MPANKDIDRKTYNYLKKQFTKEHYKQSLTDNYDLDPMMIREMELVRLERKIKYYQDQIWPWLEKYAVYCKNMLNEILQELEGESTSIPALPSTEEKPLQLIDLFEKPLLFPKIINILADEGFCDRHTYAWDLNKATKSKFAALMKVLFFKGYLKRDFSRDGRELVEIAKNTFRISISQQTASRAKHSDIVIIKNDPKELIKPASTLSEL